MNTQKITKLLSKAKEAYKIVSISTIEHVGWDEKPRDPKKIPLALENLTTKCLAPGGEIVVTLPIGYNAYLDKLLKEDKIFIPFTEQYYLKRISDDNKWIQVGGGVKSTKQSTVHRFLMLTYSSLVLLSVVKVDRLLDDVKAIVIFEAFELHPSQSPSQMHTLLS